MMIQIILIGGQISFTTMVIMDLLLGIEEPDILITILIINNTFSRNGVTGNDPNQLARGGIVLTAGSNIL